MLNKIKEFIRENNLIEYDDKIVVGVSGGADSVCLLRVLTELKEDFGLKLWAVHINHGIRGEEAQRDENFVRELSERLGAEFLLFSYDVPKIAAESGVGLEEAGRNLRYAAFNEAALKVGANKIALAHNKNDNAETMLQRLLRGTGLKGLGGIAPKRDGVIRPLLCLTRTEIEEHLGDFEYITDSTNLQAEYTRNKIRLKLIPELEKDFNPNLTETLYRTSLIIRKENDFLENEGERAFKKAVVNEEKGRVILDCFLLSKENEVIIGRALRRAVLPLTKKGQDIELKHIEALWGLVFGENGKSVNLIEGLRAKKEFGKLVIGKFSEEIVYEYEIYPEKEVFIDEAHISVLITAKKRGEKEVLFLKRENIYFPLVLRTKRKGDRLKIKGGHQELKKIYAEKKIPKEDRHKYPILAAENEIISVLGLKTAYGHTAKEGEKGLYVYLLLNES